MARGRRTKLDPGRQARLCKALAEGNTREAASRHAGVSAQTFCSWMARGRKAAAGQFREFLEAVKKAENEAEMRNVAVIGKAARKNWTASAWWLERRRNASWGRKDTTKLTGAGRGGEVVVVLLGAGQRMEDL